MDKWFYFELCTYAILAAAYFRIKIFAESARKIQGVLRKVNLLQFTIFAFAFVFLYTALLITNGHNWGGDFSQYLAQARAILTGELPQWLDKQSFIIENSTPGFAPLIYPWGLSVILLPVYKIFGLNFIAFKMLEAIFFAGAMVLFFIFMQSKFDSQVAAVAAAIILLNTRYLLFVDNVLSELPCLFFSMLTILLVYKRNVSTHKIFCGALIGATIFCSVQMRSLALALLIALALDDFLTLAGEKFSKTKIKERAAPYVVYVVLSAIVAICLPSAEIFQAGYLVTFSFKPADIFSQVADYTLLLGEFLFPLRHQNAAVIFVILWLIIAAIGMLKNFREDRFLIFYTAVTIGVILIFNTIGGLRYFFGILPVLIYFAVVGIKILLRRENICRGIVAVILSAFLVFDFVSAAIFPRANDAYSKDAVAVYNFINKNISDDAVIYFFKPRVLYFNTNVYSYGATADVGEEDLHSADYILFWERDWYGKLKARAHNSAAYELIFANDNFKLYKINMGRIL